MWLLSSLVAFAVTPMHLESVDVDVDISGPLAELVITQRFRNVADVPFDGMYVFPLDGDAFVDGLSVRVEGQHFRSSIRAAEDVRPPTGVGRVLARQEQRFFRQRFLDLPPHAAVDVELRVIESLAPADGRWDLGVPLSSLPRFVPLDAAPEPELADPGVRATVDLVIRGVGPIRDLESASHPAVVAVHAAEGRVRLRDVPLLRDVLVRWRTASDPPAAQLFVAGEYAMLVVEPPPSVATDARVPREIVWVVDRDVWGSNALAPAIDATLAKMGTAETFALWTEARAFDAPAVAGPDAIEEARRIVRSLGPPQSRPMSTTTLLKAALALPVDPARRRMIVLVEDHFHAIDRPVLSEVAAARNATVGSLAYDGPLHTMLEDLAAVTGGIAASPPVDDGAMKGPVWTDLEVDWGACAVDSMVPARLPDLRDDRLVRVLVRFDQPCAADVTLRYRSAAGRAERVVGPVSVPSERALAATFAGERIAAIERARRWGEAEVESDYRQAALDGQLATDETSLLVEPVGSDPGADLAPVQILPVPPDGEGSWGAPSRFLRGPPESWLPHHWTGEFTDLLPTTYDPMYGHFILSFDPRWGAAPYERLPSREGRALGGSWGTPVGREAMEGAVTATADATADGATGGSIGGTLAGRVAPQRAWFGVDAHAESERWSGVESRAFAGAGSLAVQTVAHQRWVVEGTADVGSVAGADRVPYDAVRGRATWMWEPAPATRLTSVAGAAHHAVGDAARDIVEVRTALALALAPRSRLGPHAFAAGLGAARAAWTGAEAESLASAFAEDRWSLLSNLELAGAVQVDARYDRRWTGIVSPRLAASWAPSIAGRSAVEVEIARAAAPEGWVPDAPLPTTDVITFLVRGAVAHDWWLSAAGSSTRSRLPFALPPDLAPVPPAAEMVERTVPQLRLEITRSARQRWEAGASWVLSLPAPIAATLLRDPRAPFVPQLIDGQRVHLLVAGAQWALPTDPWTATIGARATWGSAIDRSAGRWWLAARSVVEFWYGQAFDVRHGQLELRFAGARVANDPSATVLPLRAFAILPDPPAPGEGVRAEVSLTWRE